MSDNLASLARRRAAVAKAAAASGVSADHLTTHADIFGLDEQPYDEMVCIAPGAPDDNPTDPGWRWKSYLWASYAANERMRRGLLPPPPEPSST